MDKNESINLEGNEVENLENLSMDTSALELEPEESSLAKEQTHQDAAREYFDKLGELSTETKEIEESLNLKRAAIQKYEEETAILEENHQTLLFNVSYEQLVFEEDLDEINLHKKLNINFQAQYTKISDEFCTIEKSLQGNDALDLTKFKSVMLTQQENYEERANKVKETKKKLQLLKETHEKFMETQAGKIAALTQKATEQRMINDDYRKRTDIIKEKLCLIPTKNVLLLEMEFLSKELVRLTQKINDAKTTNEDVSLNYIDSNEEKLEETLNESKGLLEGLKVREIALNNQCNEKEKLFNKNAERIENLSATFKRITEQIQMKLRDIVGADFEINLDIANTDKQNEIIKKILDDHALKIIKKIEEAIEETKKFTFLLGETKVEHQTAMEERTKLEYLKDKQEKYEELDIQVKAEEAKVQSILQAKEDKWNECKNDFECAKQDLLKDIEQAGTDLKELQNKNVAEISNLKEKHKVEIVQLKNGVDVAFTANRNHKQQISLLNDERKKLANALRALNKKRAIEEKISKASKQVKFNF